MMLALAWLLFIKLERSRICAYIFLLPGLLVLGIYATQFVGFPISLRRTFFGQIRYFVLDLGARSRLFQLASFRVVAGLAASLRPNQPTPAAPLPPSLIHRR